MTTRSVLGHVVMDIPDDYQVSTRSRDIPDDYQVSTRSHGHGHT